MTVPARTDPRAAPPLPEEPPAPGGRRRPGLAGRVLPPLVFNLLVLGAWKAYTELADISPLLLPSPFQVAQSVVDNASLLARNALVTLQEILIRFALGSVTGIALAVLLTYSRWPSGRLPLAGRLPDGPDRGRGPHPGRLVRLHHRAQGDRGRPGLLLPDRRQHHRRAQGRRPRDGPPHAHPWHVAARIMRSVRVPSALPYLFSGLKVAMALSVIGAVFGEWVGASEGLGYLMLALNNQLATVDLFAAVLVLSVMGIVLFFLVGLIERLVIPWHHESRRALQQQQ
jgi:NitT/TauT family transport system permease protein